MNSSVSAFDAANLGGTMSVYDEAILGRTLNVNGFGNLASTVSILDRAARRSEGMGDGRLSSNS